MPRAKTRPKTPPKRKAKPKSKAGAADVEKVGTAFRDVDALRDVAQFVLAKVIGVSTTTIQNRPEVYVKLKGKRGHYDLIASAHNYIAKLKGEGVSGEVLGDRGRLYKEQTRKLELANAELSGELLKMGEAAAATSELCTALRAAATSLPGRVAQQAAGMTRAADVRALLNDEVDELLRAIEQIATERLAANGEASANVPAGRANSKADAAS